jgi:hypothetical protein
LTLPAIGQDSGEKSKNGSVALHVTSISQGFGAEVGGFDAQAAVRGGYRGTARRVC